MELEPGRNLLHYRIVDKIGEGGMGAVWRAVDTHLDREVAIKLLPPLFSDDPDRVARFDREAKLLASLNHPNIAGIYGFHPRTDDQTASFLVMELVEGEDLAERLARGPLPVEESLDVARQTAHALEEAHRGGVIHRDLKPANIKLTPDGKVKVLDFGLAKAFDTEDDPASGISASLSPTLTSAGTRAGMILGTAAYMSPEQARGKALDRRTDLWSLGCVIWECLTGGQLFRGETVSDSLAAILRKEPDWSLLPQATPPMIRLLLRRLLTRDPGKRLQDAGDARLELEQAIEDPGGESLGIAPTGEAAAAPSGSRAWLGWAVAVVALLAAMYFGMSGRGSGAASAETLRLTIPVPGTTIFGDLGTAPPTISPDGRTVVFGIEAENGATQLWLRPLDDFTARPLKETENAQYVFWSPDSRHIGFFQRRDLKRLEIATGQIQTILAEAAVERFPRGASWHRNGKILFAPDSNSGIHVVDAASGETRQLTTPDPEIPDSSHRWPQFLPDGEHFLFLNWTNELNAQEEYSGVFMASLAAPGEVVRILPDKSSALHAPGQLIVKRGENLVALPFDEDARRVTGEAKVIAPLVDYTRANGHVAASVSKNGNLAYAVQTAGVPTDLIWYEREGENRPSGLDPDVYWSVSLSPGGRQAISVIPGASGDGQLWHFDLERGVRTRLADETWTADNPAWSADGKRVMYGSQLAGSVDFYTRRVDGSETAEPVLVTDADKNLFDWSRDGDLVAYSSDNNSGGTDDIEVYSIAGGKAVSLIAGAARHRDACFSPDARWIAFVSDETGSPEVFVQAFDREQMKVGARLRVSTAGGGMPHWRDDGREIVYFDGDGRAMAVAFEPQGGNAKLSRPRELFQVHQRVIDADATGDHRRFLVATREAIPAEPLHVILDWPAGL